jgi:DNA-directed RNA polymerase specialized sigma24 family protein
MRWRRNGDFTLKSGKAKGAADLMDMQLLRAADGLSYDKIGALYKISGNTARRRLEEAAKRARAAH